MRDLKFSTVVRETGAVAKGLPADQSDAQLSLLKSAMLERLGVDMSGLFGIDNDRVALAEIYYGQERAKLNLPEGAQLDEATANQMRRAAMTQADEFVETVNQSLDLTQGQRSRKR